MCIKYLITFSLVFIVFACNKNSPPDQIFETGDPPVTPGLIKVIHDRFENEEYVLIGSSSNRFIMSFYTEAEDGTPLEFRAIQSKLPLVMHDLEGTQWDVFGHAIAGPREGERLKPTQSCMGYWFAFSSHFPGATIYGEGPIDLHIAYDTVPGWLIPPEHIVEGAQFDRIPSLQNPSSERYSTRVEVDNPFYVQDHELVLGVKLGEKVRLYPHKVLNWHEIVNDTLNNMAISLIYAPLTGTGTVWDRVYEGVETTLGVSGMIYSNNILAFDRYSQSLWSQLRQLCISGHFIGTIPQTYPVVEMPWGIWKNILSQPDVLSDKTGTSIDYNQFPLTNYLGNHDYILYPIVYDDTRLPRKERVHGVIVGDKVKVYRFSDFE